jgi:hypothetical protein
MTSKDTLICIALCLMIVKIFLLISSVGAQTLSVGVRALNSGAQYVALTDADGWGSVKSSVARSDETKGQILPLAYVPAVYTPSQGVVASDTYILGADSDACAIHCTQNDACVGYRMNSFNPPDCTIYLQTEAPTTQYAVSVNIKCRMACTAQIVFLFDHTQNGLVEVGLSSYTIHMSALDAVIDSMSVVENSGRVVEGAVSQQGLYAEADMLDYAPKHANVTITTNGPMPTVFPPIAQTHKSNRDSNLDGAINSATAALISIACIFVAVFIYIIARHTRAMVHDKNK